jgi:ferric-dicitrate binding protein FerR (iron transport regulator)
MGGKHMKRILAMILTVCLLLSCVPFAMAAPAKTSAAAKALRLEATEGTVQMKNAAGRNLKLKGGTRLYNGYTLTTQKASYAYVSLDETKAVKLGASTKSEVFRSGKKLELKVSSGELFFNVKVPLKSDESLTIRTSTMVTSVRGTCGWVEVLDRHTTQVSLLEGKLDITSTDPLTREQRTTTIEGGQTATIVYLGDERRTSGVIVEDLTIQDLIEADVIHDENIILTDTGLTVEELEALTIQPCCRLRRKRGTQTL